MKYTYKDVIIDPDDPRVEIGKDYFFGDSPAEVLKWANSNHETHRLRMILKENYPFSFEGLRFPCIIRKKEPEYLPFDLSKEEDRNALRGKWVKDKKYGNEWMVSGFYIDEVGGQGWKAKFVRKNAGFTGQGLLEMFTFLDGSPVGKEQIASKWSAKEEDV